METVNNVMRIIATFEHIFMKNIIKFTTENFSIYGFNPLNFQLATSIIGAVFGCYGTLMIGFGIGLGLGLANGILPLSITMGVLLVLSTIVLGIVLVSS